MNKQAQDKIWNELSEESKKKIQEGWQMIQEAKANNDLSFYGVGKQDLYKELFGEHNLNPKPIKKEGWVNVYRNLDSVWVGNTIYKLKQSAIDYRGSESNYLTTVKIEWEE